MTVTVDKKSHEYKTFIIIIKYDGTDFHGQVVNIDDAAIRSRMAADLGVLPLKGRGE